MSLLMAFFVMLLSFSVQDQEKLNMAAGSVQSAFGIQPTPLGAVAGEWLGRFREGGRFAATRPYSTVG